MTPVPSAGCPTVSVAPTDRPWLPLYGVCGEQGQTGRCRATKSACMPDNNGVWKCSCVPGYVEKGDNCSKLPEGIFSDSEMSSTIPATAPVGHTVLTTTFSQILDICTTNPEVTLIGDTDLFKADVDSCHTLTIRTLSALTLESSVRKLMVKAKFENGVNVIMDAIFVTVTIQRTGGNVVVVLPDMTFSDHLVTSVAPGKTLTLSNSDYMTIGSNGAVYTTQQLSVDAIASESVEAAVPLTTNIQRRDGTSTTTTSLTAVILKTDIKIELPEDTANNYIVVSFKRLHQSSLNISVTSDLNSNIFAFNGTVLKVQNSAQLDYDNGQRSFTFTIVVKITTYTDVIAIPVTVDIEVLSVNDNTPVFITDTGIVTNQYNFVLFPTPLSTVVCGAVRARDADPGSQLTYTLDQKSDMTNYFSVGQKDGIVTTLVKTDNIPFINNTNIGNELYVSFPIQVRDENILHTVTTTVNVSLRRTPERNLGLSFEASIAEDAPLQAPVVSVFRSGYTNYEFASRTGSTLFFTLNPGSGQVSVDRSLDRETQDSHKFSVTAIEEKSQTCALVVMGDLIITILDTNDNPPVFDRESYYGKVEENMPSNTVVEIDFPITATDKDTGGFTFRITQESIYFTISQSGVMSTRQTFDRETKSFYIVKVMADDGKNNNQAMVNVTIGDQNDNIPVFTSPSYSATIQEGTTNTNLLITAAVDADTGDNADLFYLLHGGGDGFVIGYESGVISVPAALDREEQSSHNLVVTVIDGGDPPQNSTTIVTVMVADVNDNFPKFLPGSLVITTDEEVSCSNSIGQLNATDEDDTDVLRYSSSDSRFTVDANSGEIRCKGRLDYEAEQQLNMEVIVGDSGVNPRQTTATVVIILRDINDNSPIITHPGTTSLQQKDFSAITPIMVVDVEDEDSGENGEVIFSLIQSNLVTIDDNGIISTVQRVTPPDAGTYTAVVKVIDKGIPPRSVTSTVTVQVNADTIVDIKFLQQHHMFTVSEEQVSNTIVGDVSQSLDNPRALTAKYDIPNPTGKFAINTDTGVISTNVVFDRETESRHIVVVRVRADGTTAGDLTLVNVSIADTNDHSPVFPRDKYRLIVEENVALSSVIAKISATDEDVGINADIYFSLHNSTNSVCWQDFTINEMNGELSVVKTIDYETYIACQFTVRAFDKSSSPRTSSIEVDVTITDVNDNSPIFSKSTYLLDVAENLRSETSVFGTVSDADSNENGRIELSDSGKTSCPFTIKTGTTSLIMTLSGHIDYERETSYTCVIVATDMATSNRRTSSATVNVNITDVNDNAPVFDKLSYEVNISRDLSLGKNVIVVMATDADSGLNKRIQYTLTGDEGYLSINANTGQVYIEKSLYNYRRDTMVTVVTAIDQLPGVSDRLSSSVTLIINIADANVRPNFPMATVYQELREETEVTGVFYTVTANDWDGTTNRKCLCSYRFEKPSSVFEIDSQTGEIRMKFGTSLDRERVGPYYSLGIIARDKGSPPKDSETLVLKITVLDINDQAPQFRYSTIRTFTIYQTHPSGSSIGTVTADDMDGSEFSKTLYNVTDLFYSSSATFSVRNTSVLGPLTIVVDSNNGTLRTTRSLELFGQTLTFYIMLTIEAVDKDDPSMRDSTPVIVEVKYEDPNQHFPVFYQDMYQTEIPRSYSLNEVVLRVTATDADAAPKNAIRYSIIAGNYRDLMTIDPITGEIKLAYLIDEKFDTSNLTLTVRASDSGDVPKHSSTIVKITLSGQYISCFTAEMRTEIVAEKDLFFGVMIGLVGALCIAIGLCFVFIYKYCNAAKQLDVYIPGRTKKNEMTYQDLRPPSEQQEHEYTSNEGSIPNQPYMGGPGTDNGNHHYMSIRGAGGVAQKTQQTGPYASIPETQTTAIMNPAFTTCAEDVLVTVPHQRV